MSLKKIGNISLDILGYASGIGFIGLVVVTCGYLLFS